MASYGGNVAEALLPLTAYSLGLGLPFIAMGALLGTAKASIALRWMTQHAYLATAFGSIVLIVVGVLMFTGVI